ncbi:hypothetical protein A3860_13655 [Niastella vici]|uniref:PNPLA domain-containing protein n=1 Tax=Niastella vici TaxID=1703345 RepID=A0A1V9G793_9BACT|nr:patatin-like phospholipase family protein [Niastella vici]OQP66525.1 hypothetical protein A3860_13655 [Niastella vici]
MLETSQLLKERLAAKGPKRILALDGGGLRGAVTLGFLEKIEATLAERHQHLIPKKDFRLHHYFDLIGGTSTGSIIAALLAVGGYSVGEIKKMYKDLGGKIFSDHHGFNLLGKQIYLDRKYDSTPLKEELEKIFGDARLGDNTNKTGLCIVTKRLDTCSTWPVTNNPNAIYYEENRFFIKEIVRASTAAPSYFEPQLINVGKEQEGIFVDGGMSIMNNPALQLFLVATLKGYRLDWKMGENNLLIVSVGTGRRDKKLTGNQWKDPKLWNIAQFAPDQLMSDANDMVELMMHFIGKGTGVLRKIDTEVENLSEDILGEQKACSYVRYNVEMVKDTFDKLGITNLSEATITNIMNMDVPANIDLLTQIGVAAAGVEVKAAHLPEAFDLKTLEFEHATA